MPTIEISDAVWVKLQELAEPLIDTPDSILKRELGIVAEEQADQISHKNTTSTRTGWTKSKREGIGELEFRRGCLVRAKSIFPNGYKRAGRVVSESPDGNTGAVTLVSKAHDLHGSTQYWYGFQESHSEELTSYKNGYLILGCGSPETTLAIPIQDMMQWVDSMNRTKRQESFYWHIHVHEENSSLILHLQEGVPRVNLDRYRLSKVR